MDFLNSVTDALTSAKSRPEDGSKGAYWCDDCDVRIRDVELDVDPSDDETPTCSDCGAEMRFERATGRSCSC